MNKSDANQRGVLTDIGQQKVNAHAAAGTKLIISHFVIGDGNGQPVIPNKAGTSLTHEIGKEPITETTPGILSGGIFMSSEMTTKYQGQWIREAGLVDSDGDLIVWCSYAPTLISQFTERKMMINIPILSSDVVSIVVDTTKKWATQEQLDKKLDATATAENSKLLNGKTAEELSGGEWQLIRTVNWVQGVGVGGVLLGSIADVLRHGFKIVGYNSDGERVWIPQIYSVGVSPTGLIEIANSWFNTDLYAHDGLSTKFGATYRYSSGTLMRARRSTWIFGNSPRKPMTLSVIPSSDEIELSDYSTSFAWATGHALLDLAKIGLSKSDDLYVFFQSESGLFQVIDNIKVYKRNS